MPKYELMYLLSSAVSDDQVKPVTEMVRGFLDESKATDVTETNLGKKKLAYPIKKTRNGTYVVVTFDMDSANVNTFEARVRNQKNTIIRHLIVSLDEHLVRKAKDEILQSKLPKREEAPTEEKQSATIEYKTKTMEKTAIDAEKTTEVVAEPAPEAKTEEPAAKPARTRKPKAAKADILDLNTEELDKKIEAALSEDLLK